MKKSVITLLIVVFLGLAAWFFLGTGHANAQSPTPLPPAGKSGNDACLACHSKPGMETTLPSGEVLYLTINQQTYDNSVHGVKNYACTQCHTNITSYPHPALPATVKSRRDVTLNLYQTCQQCHQDKFDAATNDAHKQARDHGNEAAAVCTDCHSAHDVTDPVTPRSKIPQTCARCHSEIYNLYRDSVHGAALIGKGNPDVPSCVDCHNAHNVQGPSNTQFRLFSPQICARCHANQQLMAKYGINTNVFNTYLTDFHGTTVEMFQALAPGQETNKPACIDCHGVHDVNRLVDANNTVIKEKILTACQKCHPGASPNFPSAWLNHYTPSPEHYPVVYFVTVFYQIFVPGVLGIMGIFVLSDLGRKIADRVKKGKRS